MRRFLFISIYFLASSCGKDENAAVIQSIEPNVVVLKMHLDKDVFVAGALIEVKGKLNHDLTEPILCIITHSLGEYSTVTLPKDRSVKVTIPDFISNKAGQILLSFICDRENIGSIKLSIVPGEPYKKIDSYSGPATIESSGIDWHLVTGIVKDQYDNPCADGTEINYALRYPDNRNRKVKQEMLMLLSGVRIDPANRAGKIITGIQSGTAHSAEREVLVTPTWPERFSLEVIDYIPYAEQRQVLKLQTSVIRDSYGNLVADGTSVIFAVKSDQNKVDEYRSFTVNGRSDVQIENPNYQTTWTIKAQIDGSVTSYPISLFFSKSNKTMPLSYDESVHQITIGPVVGPLGQFVPNGVIVDIELINKYGQLISRVSKEMIFGHYYWKLPLNLMETGTYQVITSIGDSKSEIFLEYDSSKNVELSN